MHSQAKPWNEWNGNNGTLTSMDPSTDWVASTAFNAWIGSEWATGGNWMNNSTFTANSSTVVLNGSGNATLAPGGSSFYNLTLNKSASDKKLSPSADMTVGNALTITKGTFDLDTSDVNLSLGGALSIGADGRWTKSSEARTVTFTSAGSITDNSTGGPQNLGHVKVE